jgi:hypothetical protein
MDGPTDMTKLIDSLGACAERVKMLATELAKTFRLLLSPKLKFPCTDDTFYWDVTRGAVLQIFTSVTEKHAVSSVTVFYKFTPH